jgi:hypothetical protein
MSGLQRIMDSSQTLPPTQVESGEPVALIACLPAHHRDPSPLKTSSRRNRRSPEVTSDFSILILI